VTAQTVKKVMQQRLTRGARVVVAESYSDESLHGKTMTVTSKGPVKCNRGGRCAGDWCVGYAVFVSEPGARKNAKKGDKRLGWRAATKKICLTHLKDEQGTLLVPPPIMRQQQGEERPHRASRRSRRKRTEKPKVEETKALPAPTDTNGADEGSVADVSWSDMADAHQAGDINSLAMMARRLKAENERLKNKMIGTQERLIDHLTK